MRIVFICGTLQAGSDGVADYTLRLARELSLHTIDCFFLSLHDRFVPADVLIDDTNKNCTAFCSLIHLLK